MTALDTLHAASIREWLPADAQAAFAAIDVVDDIDSTNAELLRRKTPATGIVALFADAQQAGRGRQGRRWTSPPGANLYLSLARCFPGEFARLGGLSLAVGVATAEAMRTLGAFDVDVKWPNDLVVDDASGVLRKLGGILIEGGMQDGCPRAIIGIGLNVRMPADAATGIDQPWTDLQSQIEGGALPRAAVAAALLASLASALQRFDSEGLAPFLPRFDAMDALRHMHVCATVGERTVEGVAMGVQDDGALLLRTQEGLVPLRAGEVSIRRRAPAQA